MNFILCLAQDKLILYLKQLGITDWNQLTKYIQNLSYGRNTNRHDLTLVLTEQKGTCSSKHAFLKKVADLNGVENIKLYIGIYKMNPSNTPKMGNILSENEFDYELDYIPEAHCYLKINGVEYDFTHPFSDFEKLRYDILEEIEIEAEQVSEFKVKYHQDFLREWITKQNEIVDIVINFEAVWKLREQCICNLSQ
ncbi:hypothetical protein [Bernardetia sp.]|uniref:hypothetical protein n=1 Tax=Bernardetia sp. TaxID=1937974 RepID=UPI0025BBE7AE|nr:hypothetical protein [Bernardetia sp.]